MIMAFLLLLVITSILINHSFAIAVSKDDSALTSGLCCSSQVQTVFEMDSNFINSISTQNESRIETFVISIPQLDNRQRNIQVYLPPHYDATEKNFPVFYLFDGAYLFDPPPVGYGDYAVDETLNRLIEQGLIDGAIIVGIEHDFDIPWDEYSPWINENMYDWVVKSNADREEGGKGFEFLDFIVNTLKPEIDRRYKTLDDRENTFIGGFCRMGLIPLIAGIEYPEVFSGVMSMSPTVWFAEGGGRWLSNNRLIDYIENTVLPENVKFYIDVGTDEASGNRPPVRDEEGNRITYPQAYVEGAEVLVRNLRENGVPDTNLYFQIFEGSKGGRDEWAKRIDDVVLWFFSDAEPQPQPQPTQTEEVLPVKPTKDEQTNTGDDIITPIKENYRFEISIILLVCGLITFFLILIPLVLVILLRKKTRN